ncbi:MAG: hypothetical protein Q9227_006661 [Pyrenula ochraceoflavens]
MTKNDDLFTKLQSFDPNAIADADYDKQLKHTANYLSQLSQDKLVAGTSGGDDFLTLLDPTVQTIPYLFVLTAHIQHSSKKAKSTASKSNTLDPDGPLWAQILVFLREFDPLQIKYVSAEFRELLEIITKTANANKTPSLAIIPIRDAILRLNPTSSILTSAHCTFVRQCLIARMYDVAVPVVDPGIYHIPYAPERGSAVRVNHLQLIEDGIRSPHLSGNTDLGGKVNSREYMEYFLNCGTIYIGLKKWEKALFCLEVVLAMPTANVASMVMVHAYKRWALVGLLLKGKPLDLPRTVNQPAAKAIRAIAKPYDVVLDAFKDVRITRLEAEMEYGRGVWDGDCNTGLIREVYFAHRKFAILNLEKTFTALSISQIASRTSPDPLDLTETEAYISSLISSGELAATLSPSKNPSEGPIVRFLPSQIETKSEADLQNDLAKHKAELATLLQHIESDEHRLEISNQYIDFLKQLRKKAGEIAKEKETLSSTSKNGLSTGADYEEDVMADMP